MERPTSKSKKVISKEQFFSKILSSLIFILCIIGFIWQTIRCVTVYLEKPLGSEISKVSTKEIPFPEIVVCYGDSQSMYDPYALLHCGITSVEMYSDYGHWLGTCTDPQELFENNSISNVMTKNENIKVTVTNLDGNTFYNGMSCTKNGTSDVCEPWNYNASFLSIKDTKDFGRCGLITIDEMMVKEGITEIDVFIKGWMGATRLFVETPNGLYQTIRDPGAIIDSSYSLIAYSKNYIELKVEMEYYETVPTKKTQCSLEEDTDWDSCFMNEIHEMCMDALGCSHPWGPNKTVICTTPEKAMKAMEIKNKHMRSQESKCLKSCKYIETHVTYIDSSTSNDYGATFKLFFNTEIKKTESYLSYTTLSLFAEVGGYLGIFIGNSILDIRGMLEQFIKYRCV